MGNTPVTTDPGAPKTVPHDRGQAPPLRHPEGHAVNGGEDSPCSREVEWGGKMPRVETQIDINVYRNYETMYPHVGGRQPKTKRGGKLVSPEFCWGRASKHGGSNDNTFSGGWVGHSKIKAGERTLGTLKFRKQSEDTGALLITA
jgi:hypothetical protein